MFIITPIAAIRKTLLSNRQTVRNFPKSIVFPFKELYVELVTRIKTTEISADCVLFDSVQSCNETKAFSDRDYWAKDCVQAEIDAFWIFGQNGQGDLWLFDSESQIYFYDHNQGSMSKDHFTDLQMNFEKWLQFAHLNKQLDRIYEARNEIDEACKSGYRAQLKALSNTLLDNYPFSI